MRSIPRRLAVAAAGVALCAAPLGAQSDVEQQGGKFDNVPAAVPRDNVLFFQRHQEELKRISAELRALEGQEEAPEFD